MQRSSALGLSSCLAVLSLGCRMDNPAFGDDEFAGESSESPTTDASTGPSETETSADGSTTAPGEPTTASETTTDESSDAATDSDSSSDAATDSDTGVECDPNSGLTECAGACVDLDIDPDNCGACGHGCTADELCLGSCLPLKYVFVSSEPRTGAMGGIGGADDLCDELAASAGLPGTYFAWNSTELSYPDAFVQDGSAYRRTDGDIVAVSYEDLTDNSLSVPINLDENQLAPPLVPVNSCPNLMGAVWSNTTPLGEFAGIPNCASWTSAIGLGKVGSFLAFDSKWSQAGDCQVSCAVALPIYCVQQDP